MTNDTEAATGESVAAPLTLTERQTIWASNRAAAEARYRQHLLRGPDRCGCRVCQRGRANR